MQNFFNILLFFKNFLQTHDPFLFYNNYFINLLFIIISILLVYILILIPYGLSGRTLKTSETISEYECGFEPFDSAIRAPFTVEFYIIGMLFLIFDVEITLVLPWSVIFTTLPYQSLILMLFFLLLLAAGFLYEASLGVLDWGKSNKTKKKNLLSLLPYCYYDDLTINGYEYNSAIIEFPVEIFTTCTFYICGTLVLLFLIFVRSIVSFKLKNVFIKNENTQTNNEDISEESKQNDIWCPVCNGNGLIKCDKCKNKTLCFFCADKKFCPSCNGTLYKKPYTWGTWFHYCGEKVIIVFGAAITLAVISYFTGKG